MSGWFIRYSVPRWLHTSQIASLPASSRILGANAGLFRIVYFHGARREAPFIDLRKSKTAPDEHPEPFAQFPSSLPSPLRGEGEVEGLNVEVEGELPGVRAQADGINLVFPLVVDPGINGILGEDVPLQEKLMIGLKGV